MDIICKTNIFEIIATSRNPIRFSQTIDIYLSLVFFVQNVLTDEIENIKVKIAFYIKYEDESFEM